jgi:GMP synthase (glutamine-hydrolysing)
VLGIQFHPEVAHTPLGAKVIENFLVNVCEVAQSWTPASFVDRAVEEIRAQVGDGRVLLGLSGGVDSSVAAALIHKAIGDQLTPVFVNNGLLRQGEAEQVREVFARGFGMPLVYADATDRFLGRLAGRDRPRGEAEDHRRHLRPRLRGGGRAGGGDGDRPRSRSWPRARSTPT